MSGAGDMVIGSVDARKFNTGGNAGSITLASTGNINVGDITARVQGFAGSAGSVIITTSSGTQFQSGAGSSGINRSGVIDLQMSADGDGGTLKYHQYT